MKSSDYHDYVIKDGKLVGDFEGMYRNSKYIPWHQDKTAYDVTDTQLLFLIQSYKSTGKVVEIGCGLGYFSNRLEDLGYMVTGLDISATAIVKAKVSFPRVVFGVLDITKPTPVRYTSAFDIILVKEIFWYVFPHMNTVLENIRTLVSPNGMIFISQAFPPNADYVGKEVIHSPEHLIELMKDAGFSIEYYSENHNRSHNFETTLHLVCKQKPKPHSGIEFLDDYIR